MHLLKKSGKKIQDLKKDLSVAYSPSVDPSTVCKTFIRNEVAVRKPQNKEQRLRYTLLGIFYSKLLNFSE